MSEAIPHLPLVPRRKYLGYMIPAFNVPLFLYNVYQMMLHFQDGMAIGSNLFWEDFVVIISTAFLTYSIPKFFPVYTSKYTHKSDGITLNRLLHKEIHIPYKDINRAEVYLRVEDEISNKSTEYATEQSSTLRKSGFKFKDYTNADNIIMNLFVGKDIYMLSPEKPKALLKELKRKNKKLSARIVELTKRGPRIQDLG